MGTPLTFDQYKLLEDGGDHFNLAHPDGSSFKVAKAGLDDSMLSKIGNMPVVPPASPTSLEGVSAEIMGKKREPALSFADVSNFLNKPLGGLPPAVVADPSLAPGLAPAVAQERSKTMLASNGPVPVIPDGSGAAATGTPVDLAGTVGAPQTPTSTPTAPAGGTPEAMINKAFDLQKQGIMGAAKAGEQAAQEQAVAYASQEAELEKYRKAYDTEHGSLVKENNDLTKSVMDAKIDPNRFLGSMSTGNKILAGISLALGGLAQGLSGSNSNPVLDQINKFIDKDMEAQKLNLDKKTTLLSQNMQKMRNAADAEALTRSQIIAVTAAKVNQAIAKAASPEAKARGQVLLGQLQQQQAVLTADLAKKRVLESIGKPGLTVNPEALPAESRERLVKAPNGQQYLATSKTDADDLKTEIGTIEPIFSQVDKLEALGAGAIVDPNKRESAKLIVTNIANLLKKNQGLARPGAAVGKEDYISVLDQIEDPSKFQSLFGGKDKPGLLKGFLMDKLNAKLKGSVSNFQEPYKPKSVAPGYASVEKKK